MWKQEIPELAHPQVPSHSHGALAFYGQHLPLHSTLPKSVNHLGFKTPLVVNQSRGSQRIDSGTESTILNRESGDSSLCDSNRVIPWSRRSSFKY